MPALRLTYIEGLAARAFPTRFALRVAGMAFDDERITREELATRRSGTGGEARIPLGQLPVLYVDGLPVVQSTAQARWAASRTSELQPVADADGLQALAVDEVVAVLDEIWTKIPHPRHFASLDAESAAAAAAAGRSAWFESTAPRAMRLIDARVAARGGPFLLGERPSIADAWMLAFSEQIATGAYEPVPKDFVARYPAISGAVAALKAHPLFLAHGEPM